MDLSQKTTLSKKKKFFYSALILISTLCIFVISFSFSGLIMRLTVPSFNPEHDSNSVFFIMSIGYVFITIMLILIYLKRRKKVIPYLYHDTITGTDFKNALLFLLGGNAFIHIFLALLSLMQKIKLLKDVLDNYQDLMDSIISDFSLISFFIVVIIGPLIEEMLFRGFCYRELKNIVSVRTAIILSSALFGLVHFNLIQSSYAFILGAFLAYIYEKTRSFAVVVSMHIINNFMGYISNFNIYVGVGVFILSLISLIFFKSSYRFLSKKNITQ